MNKRVFTLLSMAMLYLLCAGAWAHDVPFAGKAPVIDGIPDDIAWDQAKWVPLNQLMLGSMPTKEDFSARYKLVWTKDHLYMLAEIVDDVLYDSHADPLELYWEDDTLEIFIDEDASGGDHLHSYNAFAYHIAFDNQAADIGPFLSEKDREAGNRNVRLFPDHIQSQWKRSVEEPNKLYWEVQIAVYGDNYQGSYAPGTTPASPVRLHAGKQLGFMVAYCDADGTSEGGGREHFMGDVVIEPVNGDKNLGYLDASVFGQITLVQ